MSKDVAVLGVGMHPWGKWGQSFVKYGVAAARAALADSGVNWQDVDFIVGGETVRNGYGGYVAGATFAQALGWNGARVAHVVRRVCDGSPGTRHRSRTNPGRPQRSCPGRRRRHHAEGLPRSRRR